MDIGDAGGGLIGTEQEIVCVRHPVFFLGHGIVGKFVEVAALDKIVKRLRSCLLVESVLLNGLAHYHQIMMQSRFAGALNGADVFSRSHAEQDEHDGDYDHQFEHGEASGG